MKFDDPSPFFFKAKVEHNQNLVKDLIQTNYARFTLNLPRL